MTKELKKRPDNLRIEDTRVIYRNFAGKPTKYNVQGGKRTVGIILPDVETGEALAKDGWNVKYLRDRDTDEVDAAFISAKISYDNKPPKIVIVTNRKQTYLDAESVEILDYADIQNVDAVLTPYVYDVGGKSGISAYVKTMYVTVQEDEFADKYNLDDDYDELPFS